MKFIISIFFLFIVISNSKGQYNYSFKQIDNSDGLSNSCLNDIHKDADNLLWLASWDGLNVYNGSSFHIFNYSIGDLSNALVDNVITEVREDKKSNIWICTISGVSKYVKNEGRFLHYFYNSNKTPGNGFILNVDRSGNVYTVLKHNSDIKIYDEPTDTFRSLLLPGFSGGEVVKMMSDRENNLWILKLDGSIEAFKRSGNSFQKGGAFSDLGIDNLFMVNQTLFGITKKLQLLQFTPDLSFRKVAQLPYQVRAMTFFQGHYLFGWSSKGLGEYDAAFQPIATIAPSVPLLKSLRITSLINDNNGILWVGTDGNGVIKVAQKEHAFHSVRNQPGGQALNIPIRAFCEVNGELWVGTKGNGIIAIKNLGQKNVTFSNIKSFYAGADLLDNCVYAIKRGWGNLVFIGSDAPGLTLYDEARKKLIKWENIRGSSRFPKFNSVHSILMDKDSSLWLGLNEEGLIHLKLQKDGDGSLSVAYLMQYRYTGNNAGPGSNTIYSLANGSNEAIWVGCRYGGLSLFDKRKKAFRTIKAFSYPGSLSNNDVLSLFTDKRGRLWVGTSFGLNWVDEQAAQGEKPVFQKRYLEDGLPNNTIHAIDEDHSGNIWVSTNKGLAQLDASVSRIVQFKEADGLQSDEFSDNAAWTNDKGLMFFGGIYGFNYFLPGQIQAKSTQPNLLFSNLQLAGKTTHEKDFKVLSAEKEFDYNTYKLARQDNYFQVKIQPIDYINLSKCQYAYFLVGYDKAWRFSGSNPTISYSNLAPGDYRLLVKWTNGNGTWTGEKVALRISVRQYFWLTTPAFIVYFMIVGLVGYGVFRYRRNKFLMRQQLLMEHKLREKDEAIHQEQLDFFTKIAHELQTPLTLILGSLERHDYKERRTNEHGGYRFLSVARQEAARLHYLVHQLLEFRKVKGGYVQNNNSLINISHLFTNIAGLFEPLGEKKGLHCDVQVAPNIQVWADKDKIEKIVFNLLSNAFKHTAPHQQLCFHVKSLPHRQLEIVVGNSGCLIPEQELNRLFEKFYVLDGSQQNKLSTGIGLAYTKELVAHLKGEINVSCLEGWILFKVCLPITEPPLGQQQGSEEGAKSEQPSYLLESMVTNDLPEKKGAIGNSNKNALLAHFDKKEAKNILIVEDDESIRYLLKDILGEQYNVFEAANGKEALSIMARHLPHLIVSDVMMPDMDGLELCRIVKTTPETCQIPFVMLTAKGAIEQKMEGYEVGADAYIPKPFHTEYLLMRIRKLIEYQAKLHQYFRQEPLSLQTTAASGMRQDDKNFLESLIRIIEDNLDKEMLDSAFLEGAMALSKMQLYRKLKALSNMTPGELIRNIRLQKAAHLLKTTELSVSEVFYRTGFNNQSHFFREFKKKYDSSPNEYRAKQRLPQV